MLTARARAAFALSPPSLPFSRGTLHAAAPAFPQWKPTPWRPFSNLRPFPRAPSLSTSPKPQRGAPGNNGPSKGNGPSEFGDGELFASSPELEQLAMKSSDAPILTRIVSYNVLSSSLAADSHFPDCDPANLKASTRLKRLLIKLEGPVASRSIICLQEVSLAWSGPLHTFFANRGFHLLLASHGSYFNGYMGEGLAFPLDLYEAVDLHIERLTDFIRWPQVPKLVGVPALFSEVRARLVRAVQALAGLPRPSRYSKREPWAHARGRQNRFIFARLRSRTNGAKICVGTYHMPCIYWSPPVMMIHSALVVSRFQKLCGEDYGVLAGDFNIKPTDETYAMILRGTVDEEHRDFPPNAPDGSPASSWFPKLLAPMKSAYREVLGDEPDFTNYAKVDSQPTFIETLDYLFCTSDVDVVDVIRLPKRDAVQGPYPDATEPSDHVMIGATLRLPAASRQVQREKASVGAEASQDGS
ncbi:hypothetical protein FGB62_3g342 [Gracilaria domingensis]|nr:hypothetical protein FGB62_3g342 [Gracilaria domingensis]